MTEAQKDVHDLLREQLTAIVQRLNAHYNEGDFGPLNVAFAIIALPMVQAEQIVPRPEDRESVVLDGKEWFPGVTLMATNVGGEDPGNVTLTKKMLSAALDLTKESGEHFPLGPGEKAN